MREPDRFDEQARELCASHVTYKEIAAALRAAESSALERAAQAWDAEAVKTIGGESMDEGVAARVWAALTSQAERMADKLRALIPPAAAPAAETRMEKMLRIAGVRVLVEPCEKGGHFRNENGVTFHPSPCAAPPEGEGT